MTIIPLNHADVIFSVFGISPSSREYQRWRTEDGYRHVDFEGVLGESGSVFTMDWRESFQDVVDVLQGQLDRLGMQAAFSLTEDGDASEVQIAGKTAPIQFASADDNFDRVIQVINRLLAPTARYRKFRSDEGSDAWSYAVLRNEDWQFLETATGSTVALLFM
ncbi:MAG: hypothetical protein ACRC8S_09685 [Fimbriiglobus sp.]